MGVRGVSPRHAWPRAAGKLPFRCPETPFSNTLFEITDDHSGTLNTPLKPFLHSVLEGISVTAICVSCICIYELGSVTGTDEEG